jgi:septal ring factor EnvC (AmiA/AmiB activator)
MNWFLLIGIVATGSFFIPIFNDYTKKKTKMDLKLLGTRARITSFTEDMEKVKEREQELKTELEQAQKELSEAERERGELQRAVEALRQKKK